MLGMDLLVITLCGHSLSTHGPSVVILFAFEYVLMGLEVVRVAYRYAIHLLAARVPGEWHDRTLYTLYGKLAVDLVKLAVYGGYFLVIFTYYGMPLIMVRDLIRSAMEVRRELGNVAAARMLRRAVHSMPAPTVADLSTRDPTCSICLAVRRRARARGGMLVATRR